MNIMSRSAAHDARNGSIREAFLDPHSFKTTLPPTAQVIANEAQKLNLEHYMEDIPAGRGAQIHWLGDRSAKNVLFYIHGKVPILSSLKLLKLINYRWWFLSSSSGWACHVVE